MNRHIKKYFFYLLGIYYDFQGRYELSVKAYSEVMRYRYFFLNTQTRFSKAYKKSKEKSYLLVMGGVGDFLQCLPYMLNNRSNNYVVCTHFKNANLFFDTLKINIKHFYFYSNYPELGASRILLRNLGKVYRCPRNLFFTESKFPLFTPKTCFENNYPTLGVHFSRSQFRLIDETNRNALQSFLPLSFIRLLMEDLSKLNINVILFGTQKEIKSYGLRQNNKLKFANHKNIVNNLSLVPQCDVFLGSDSVFKSMSSMLRIPTMLLKANTNENFGSRMFIDPYIKEGVMYKLVYKNALNEEMLLLSQRTINLLLDLVKVKLQNSKRKE
jgi:hypothetical protein